MGTAVGLCLARSHYAPLSTGPLSAAAARTRRAPAAPPGGLWGQRCETRRPQRRPGPARSLRAAPRHRPPPASAQNKGLRGRGKRQRPQPSPAAARTWGGCPLPSGPSQRPPTASRVRDVAAARGVRPGRRRPRRPRCPPRPRLSYWPTCASWGGAGPCRAAGREAPSRCRSARWQLRGTALLKETVSFSRNGGREPKPGHRAAERLHQNHLTGAAPRARGSHPGRERASSAAARLRGLNVVGRTLWRTRRGSPSRSVARRIPRRSRPAASGPALHNAIFPGTTIRSVPRRQEYCDSGDGAARAAASRLHPAQRARPAPGTEGRPRGNGGRSAGLRSAALRRRPLARGALCNGRRGPGRRADAGGRRQAQSNATPRNASPRARLCPPRLPTLSARRGANHPARRERCAMPRRAPGSVAPLARTRSERERAPAATARRDVC